MVRKCWAEPVKALGIKTELTGRHSVDAEPIGDQHCKRDTLLLEQLPYHSDRCMGSRLLCISTSGISPSTSTRATDASVGADLCDISSRDQLSLGLPLPLAARAMSRPNRATHTRIVVAHCDPALGKEPLRRPRGSCEARIQPHRMLDYRHGKAEGWPTNPP
jgi:hypothetical protein